MAKSLVVCENCGIKFLKTKSQIKRSKHHFCSRQCSGAKSISDTINNSIGKKYVDLTVLSLSHIKNSKVYVNCKCLCGKECVKLLAPIKYGEVKNCGRCRGVDIKERFMSYVNIVSDSEWTWTGGKNIKGYGYFRYKGSCRLSHRVSYELFVGPIPAGMHVCHRFDDPSNVCPDSLWIGTNKQNHEDKVNKGRQYRKSPTKNMSK